VIRFAKKEDRFVMAELVLVILKDMELPFVKEIGEAKTLEILADAMLEPDYRYGFRRALVNEIDGEVAGVAFGYPDKEDWLYNRHRKKDHPLELRLTNGTS